MVMTQDTKTVIKICLTFIAFWIGSAILMFGGLYLILKRFIPA